MYGNERIFSMKEAAALARRIRRKNKKTVIATTNGCFDILHRGHFALLRKARDEGDAVIVGLNGDTSVKKLKGPRRPIRNQRDRAELLLDLPWVDYVVIFNAKESVPFVRQVRPDVHVNDSAYGYDCIEKKVVDEYGGRIAVVDKVKCMSTTEIIQRIVELEG